MKYGVLAAQLALATILPAGMALAQNAGQGSQAAGAAATTDQSAQGSDAAAGQLQEVVVTAERRSESLQQAPIAITAIEGDQLQSLHLNTMSDLQTMVPGFTDASQGGIDTTNIRGVGNAAVSVAPASGVALLRDGILMGTRIGADEPNFDLADTEVLEGPQGTFVGVSADAGVVEINSNNPNFNGFSGYALAKVGNYSDVQTQGAVNLPVSDTFAVRLAFDEETAGSFSKDIGDTGQGYFINAAGGVQPLNQAPPAGGYGILDPGRTDYKAARLKMLWKPSDNFQSLTTASYFYETTDGTATEPNPATYSTLFGAGAENGATGLQAGCTLGGPISAKQELCTGVPSVVHSTNYYLGETPFVLDYYSYNSYFEELISRFSEELRYTLPDGILLRSLSGFVHELSISNNNNSYGPQDSGEKTTEEGPNNDSLSEEINIISPTTGPFYGKVNWIAGAYWHLQGTPAFNTFLNTAAPFLPNELPTTEQVTDGPTTTRAAAIFGQISWQLADSLQLQVGARENWDNNYTAPQTPIAPVVGTTLTSPSGSGIYKINYPTTCAPGAPCVPTGYTVLSQSIPRGNFQDKVPTGKVDLNWTPAPGQNFYVFYARGYRYGGPNTFPAVSTDHPTFAAETINDWEAGWKGRLFDGHMLTQIGAYYYNYQNMQYILFDPQNNNDTTTGTYTANLAPSTIYGLEFAEQARFGGLGINVAGDYNHSSLGSVTAVNSSALPPGFGSPFSPPQCVAGHAYAETCFDYSPYAANVSGEALPYAPVFSGNIAVDYRFPLGAGTLDPRVVYSYTGKQYGSIFQIPYNELGSRKLWSASVDWIVNKWDLQLYGSNLTNQVYLENVGTTVYYGAPRQAGVQGTYRF